LGIDGILAAWFWEMHGFEWVFGENNGGLVVKICRVLENKP